MATLGCEPDADSAQPLMQQDSGEDVEKAFDDSIARRHAAEDARAVGERDIHRATEAAGVRIKNETPGVQACETIKAGTCATVLGISAEVPAATVLAADAAMNESDRTVVAENQQHRIWNRYAVKREPNTMGGIAAFSEVICDEESNLLQVGAVKPETNRGVKRERELERTRDPNLETKFEAADQPNRRIKRKTKKDERKNEFGRKHEDSKTAPGVKRSRLKQKTEVKRKSEDTTVVEVIRPRKEGLTPLTCTERSVLWEKACQKFNREKRTWLPHRPCCFPNFWLGDRIPVRSNWTSCWSKMNPKQRESLRRFVAADLMPICEVHHEAAMREWTKLYTPEVETSKVPVGRNPRGPYDPLTPSYMKLYPWMRDIPKRSWIGMGWMTSPEGCWMVHTSCGAPKGQIFEGQGKRTASEVNDKDILDSIHEHHEDAKRPGRAPALREHRPFDVQALGSVIGQTTDHRLRTNLQSHVRNISWQVDRWKLTYRGGGKPVGHYFRPSKYRKQGDDVEAAIERSFCDALACKEELMRRGIIKGELYQKPSKAPVKAEYQSPVAGVRWSSQHKSWTATLEVEGVTRQLNFRTKSDTAEEIERCRIAAEEAYKNPSKALRVAKAPSRPEFQSSVAGVSWSSKGRYWRASVKCGGEARRLVFRPENDTPEEIEQCRLAAEEACNHPSMALAVAKAPRVVDIQSPVRGVRWRPHGKYWEACLRKGEKRIVKNIKATSTAPEDIERARLVAEEVRREMELL